jgi:hypothetical protein
MLLVILVITNMYFMNMGNLMMLDDIVVYKYNCFILKWKIYEDVSGLIRYLM